MSNKKQFGVWMDSHHATIVAKDYNGETGIAVIASVKGEQAGHNSNEKTANNHEQGLTTKFFKDIASHLTNATYIHITGPGQAQEQFVHYLADTAQWKNTIAEESTSNKMNDDQLVHFMEGKLL